MANCSDPEMFFFQGVAANSTYTLKVTGPAGQFTAHADFRDATSGGTTPLAMPPGTKVLPTAPGKAHTVLIFILFVAACDVTVESDCGGGQKYCRKIAGAVNDHPILLNVLRMV